MRQTVSNIRTPSPAAKQLPWVSPREPAAGIANLQDQAAVLAMSPYGDFHRAVSGFHSMPKRIFQQRLQNKLRHECLVQGWVNRIGHAQFVLETFLHQVEVEPCDLQFFRERNFMSARSPQRKPQQVA